VKFDPTALTRLREERSMTRRELAAAAGVDPATITRLERGDRDPRAITVAVIAIALGDGELHDPILRQLFYDPGRRETPAQEPQARRG
jgi:transcriptional regulator with XRE-family HTH domain